MNDTSEPWDPQPDDLFPALRARTAGLVDQDRAQTARSALWRAFQLGRLTEQEFASTLARLDVPLEPRHGQVKSRLG